MRVMKGKYLRLISISIILALIIVSLFSLPVLAISTSPSQITINRVYVYKNCIESGDMLFSADYTLTYAPTSNTYTAGHATFTTSSTTVTGSSTHWTTAMEGGSIKSNVDGVYYLIKAVSSNTILTLDTAYAETGGSNQHYTLQYNITSAVPSDPISSTYIMRLVGSSGDIRDALPYAYFHNGYDEGLCSIYFNAADVITLGLTWANTTYYMRLDGNPSASWTGGGSIPHSNQVQSSSFTWKSSGSVGANQAIITPDILSEAQTLQDKWNSSSYILLATTASVGLKLSTTGEAYFTNALPSLTQLAPGVLLSAKQTYEYVTTTSTTTTGIASDFSGSPLDLTNAAAALHVGGMWLGILLTLGIIGWCVVSATREVNSYKPFILLTLPLLYVFTRLGWFPIWLTILLGIAAAFSIWYCIFYEKQVS